VLGGDDIASIPAVVSTGAEFVALSRAVFGEGCDPRTQVAAANALLDAEAPRFGTA
jgi:thiamine-phosphate pyrophosphorylase